MRYYKHIKLGLILCFFYILKVDNFTGKLVKVAVPQYLSAAKSYALAADSSSS